MSAGRNVKVDTYYPDKKAKEWWYNIIEKKNQWQYLKLNLNWYCREPDASNWIKKNKSLRNWHLEMRMFTKSVFDYSQFVHICS